MALVSRHFEAIQAIKQAIMADADIVAAVPNWREQKHPYNRYQRWRAGATLAPIMRQFPAHENRVHRIILPVLVSIAWPSDSELQTDMSAECAVIERIEEMFASKGAGTAPTPLRNLTSLHTGNDAYAFEQTQVRPGDAFIEPAFASGFDAAAIVIEVYVSKVKRVEA